MEGKYNPLSDYDEDYIEPYEYICDKCDSIVSSLERLETPFIIKHKKVADVYEIGKKKPVQSILTSERCYGKFYSHQKDLEIDYEFRD